MNAFRNIISISILNMLFHIKNAKKKNENNSILSRENQKKNELNEFANNDKIENLIIMMPIAILLLAILIMYILFKIFH